VHLRNAGLDVTRIAMDSSGGVVAATLAALGRGAPVIVQATLVHGGWGGRADVLLRVDAPSKLGNSSYEPVDTELARETKAGASLQLCLYADLVAEAQGLPPEYMYVVAPWSEFPPQRYRFADYGAYFRKGKRALAKAIQTAPTEAPYPLPIEHCDIWRWREVCDRRRRDDDHLSRVAGISKLQIHELTMRGTANVYGLAGMLLPLDWKASRGSSESYGRVREQARIVVEAQTAGTLKFEVLEVEPSFSLTRLPEPSEGMSFSILRSCQRRVVPGSEIPRLADAGTGALLPRRSTPRPAVEPARQHGDFHGVRDPARPGRAHRLQCHSSRHTPQSAPEHPIHSIE
jgi:predicted RecB family nuclease